jgi:RNA polymerase sigma factor (sigma-70 family)
MITGTSHARHFKPTRWSLVARATDRNASAAQAALDELCRIYWPPLCSFAQRWGLSEPDAQDVTQSFFAELLRQERFALADPERGRLRTFLLARFTKRLLDFRRHSQTVGRGGGQTILSLHQGIQGRKLQLDPADPQTPELEFDRQWALTTMETALSRLEEEYATGGKNSLFAASRPLLGLGANGHEDYLAIARELGMKESTVRVAVCRLRRRFREILFTVIADTLEEPTEANIRAEIGALIEVL